MAAKKLKSSIAHENARSLRKAREKYRKRADGLFAPCSYGGRAKGWTNADELKRLFNTLMTLLERGECAAKPFDDDMCRLMAIALTLDRVICYEGRVDEDSDPIGLVHESVETQCRKDIVLALYGYCVRAAILAQTMNAPCARTCFVDAIADMEMTGLGLSEWFRACTLEQANRIIARVERGACLLHSELYVHREAQRLSDAPEPDVELGAYARKVVEFCNFGTGRIKFRGDSERIIPPGSRKARELLRKLLVSADPNGYERLGRNWQSDFARKDANGNMDLDSDMTRIRYHIFAEPVGRRKRGTGRFRLEAKADMNAINVLRKKYCMAERRKAERAQSSLRRK